MSATPVPNARTVSAAENLRVALELADAGCDMMRERLRRDTPDASEDEIERRLVAWAHTRPGAEYGDAVGRHAPDRFERE